MALFLWGYQAWLYYTMVGLSAVALLEEVALLCLLSEWRADVRGLFWVLAKS
jgi:hypothetical protein